MGRIVRTKRALNNSYSSARNLYFVELWNKFKLVGWTFKALTYSEMLKLYSSITFLLESGPNVAYNCQRECKCLKLELLLNFNKRLQV